MLKYQHLFALLLAFLLLLPLGGCSDNSPILVGFSGQLTGKMSDLGVFGRNGALLAIEEINANGGINGRPLEFVSIDDQNTPEGALKADKALHDQGVVAIIGHMTSSIGMSVMPFINETGLVMISPTVSTPQLTGKDDFFFRTMVDNTLQATELAEYARSAMDISTVVSIAEQDNKHYTQTFTDSFSRKFNELGGVMLKRLGYSASRRMNWDAIIDPLLTLRPEAILLTCPAQDAVPIIQRIRNSGLKSRILSGAWAYTETILNWGGKYSEGVVFVIDFAADNPNPEFIKFRESYKSRFGSAPNFASTFAYEAVQALAEGLKKTNGSAEGLKEAMAPSPVIHGPIGDFRLNEYGDVVRQVFIVTVKDGKFRTIEMR